MADAGTVPRRVYLYADPSASTLDARDVAGHVQKTVGIPVTVREEFLADHGAGRSDSIAARIAAARVTDLARPLAVTEPPFACVEFERRLLESPERRVPGVLYDGPRLQSICRSVLPPKERTMRVAHVALTSRLLGSFDESDRRYHARTVVLGYPSLVSTTGLVEGPAKPREFYAAKRGMRIDTADVRYEALKEAYAGRFLDFDDPRLTTVARGYVLQAVFYHVTGEAFCDDPACVLFNAHWQEEMLHAQVESGLLCDRHRKVAEALRGRKLPAAAKPVTGGRRTRRR